jgi:hypothetical protein
VKNTFRQDDTMIAVESTPAVIDFNDLLNATRVIEDTDFNEAPWENWDGWEHVARNARGLDHADARDMQGYCRTWDRGERLVITLPAGDTDGVYRYAREGGASRQVAAETLARAPSDHRPACRMVRKRLAMVRRALLRHRLGRRV